MEPARGESCPSGQRRGPTAPEEIGSHPRIRNPSISLQLTPKTRRRKRRSPGSIPPRRVWELQLHWLVADLLGLMESARGESFPPGQRRGLASPGEDRVLYPRIRNLSIPLQLTPTTGGRKRGSPGSTPPRTVWKPQPHWLVGC